MTSVSGLSNTAGGYTPWTSLINLGLAANGTVYVHYQDGASYTTGLFTISWDGTTLTQVTLKTNSSGGTSAPALQMVGNLLQSRCFNGNASSVVTCEISFNGSILLK